MAEWVMRITDRNFDLDDYVPLNGQFTDDFQVSIKFRQYYYSTLFHSDNENTVEMTLKITGYNPALNYPCYPVVIVALARPDDPYYPNSCGVMVRPLGGTGQYTYTDFEGTVTDINGNVTQLSSPNWGDFFNGSYTTDGGIEFDYCNVPICVVSANQDEYGDFLWYYINPVNPDLNISLYDPINRPITKEILSHAVNYNGGGVVFDETTRDYFIYNRYQMSHVERGIVSTVDNIVHQQNERILYNGERGIALYRDSENPFKFNILCDTSNLVGSIYSNTSVSDVSGASFDEFTLDTLLYDSPFYSTYNSRFDVYSYDGYLGQFDTNIPLWDSLQDAQDYLDGLVDITQSPNWDRISTDNIWKDYTNNLTGQDETATEMGQSYVQNFFSQLYLCATGGINQIASSLYDVGVGSVSGLWDEIKEGVEMYGDDPMQSVQGLMFFPLDLSSVYVNVQDQNYVYFGGYKLDLDTTVKKVIFPNGYKSLGTINIVRTFKDWRDFEPYTKLYIYLPYVGTFQLQLSRYYGKSTEIRYYFDLRTGSCLVALLANGLLTDYFNGQLGVQLPITLTDKSNYANSQINTLLKGAGSIGSVIKDVAGGISAGASIPVTGAFGALQAGISVTKTVYDITQNNKSDYNKTSGGSTSMLNEFLPQYAYFIFEIQQTLDSENVQSLIGFPSNKSGNVGEFSGYLEVETVNLKCGIATDNEKRKIKQALQTGIII